MLQLDQKMNGTKKYVPRAQKTALRNTVLGNGRGHANLVAGTRSTQQTNGRWKKQNNIVG
jgi:hypothetical protein